MTWSAVSTDVLEVKVGSDSDGGALAARQLTGTAAHPDRASRAINGPLATKPPYCAAVQTALDHPLAGARRPTSGAHQIADVRCPIVRKHLAVEHPGADVQMIAQYALGQRAQVKRRFQVAPVIECACRQSRPVGDDAAAVDGAPEQECGRVIADWPGLSARALYD